MGVQSRMPIVLLDSTPLGLITHPANDKEPLECKSWVKRLVSGDILVVIPQIIDYEIRRELIRAKKLKSLQQLDLVRQIFPLVPLNENTMRKASELWAWARNTGQQTAHNENIDIDVILAAQAIVWAQQEQDYVVIATGNVDHIVRYAPAMSWQEITVENCFAPRVATLNKKS